MLTTAVNRFGLKEVKVGFKLNECCLVFELWAERSSSSECLMAYWNLKAYKSRQSLIFYFSEFGVISYLGGTSCPKVCLDAAF